MKHLDRRLAELERRAPKPLAAALTPDEQRLLERLSARLASEGQQLAVVAIDRQQDAIGRMRTELLTEAANHAASIGLSMVADRQADHD